MRSRAVRIIGGVTLYMAGYVAAVTDGWSSYLFIILISLIGWILIDLAIDISHWEES